MEVTCGVPGQPGFQPIEVVPSPGVRKTTFAKEKVIVRDIANSQNRQVVRLGQFNQSRSTSGQLENAAMELKDMSDVYI